MVASSYTSCKNIITFFFYVIQHFQLIRVPRLKVILLKRVPVIHFEG